MYTKMLEIVKHQMKCAGAKPTPKKSVNGRCSQSLSARRSIFRWFVILNKKIVALGQPRVTRLQLWKLTWEYNERQSHVGIVNIGSGARQPEFSSWLHHLFNFIFCCVTLGKFCSISVLQFSESTVLRVKRIQTVKHVCRLLLDSKHQKVWAVAIT